MSEDLPKPDIQTLMDIVTRVRPPSPWVEGDNIPWDEPGFSKRMLREHLSQEHDQASRTTAKIETHVAWIHDHVLEARPARILDIACGPGLYGNRLARRGHTYVGVDFSPASIAHAKESARSEGLDATYIQADLREGLPEGPFGLAMMIWGQLNVFKQEEAATFLARAHHALGPRGCLLIEPQTYDHVRDRGHAKATWWSSPGGVFSDRPHVVLEESFWDEASKTTTTRFHILDAQTHAIQRHALSAVAYDVPTLRAMLAAAGFDEVEELPSLTGASAARNADTLVLLAHRRD